MGGAKIHVTLTPKDGERSINSELVRGGWARVIGRPLPKLKSYVKALKADETFAKNARLNIWEYGDVSDEEEEETKRETGRPPSLAQKRANQKISVIINVLVLDYSLYTVGILCVLWHYIYLQTSARSFVFWYLCTLR